MKRIDVRRRCMALALALTLLVSMMSVAHATDDGKCVCGEKYTKTVLHEANCHEYGVVEYVCTKKGCQYRDVPILVKVDMDLSNHDAVYTDNGDGKTHTATCLYHTNYRNVAENHEFVNGICAQCGAADYSEAKVIVPSSKEVYISLNDTQATLSVGDVDMMVGNVKVTGGYTISYSWVDQNGAVVGSGETYRLPASVVSKPGDYTYGCLVFAVPKTGTSGKYISGSCTITVRVRELVTASAAVNINEEDFKLGEVNNRTPVSVSKQIYQAASKFSTARPTYIVFGAATSNDVGDLFVGSDEYYFSPSARQNDLDDVTFYPDGEKTGSYVINFTLYDAKGNDFPGVLTLMVEKDLGTLDVAYVAGQNDVVKLDTADFTSFWEETYAKGSLELLYFKELPAEDEGVLYYDYSKNIRFNTEITTDDVFYSTYTSKNQNLISDVTFVPDALFSGHVQIPFEAYGLSNTKQHVLLSGVLSIFVNSGTVKDVAFSVTSGTPVKLSSADFLEVHKTVTKKSSTDFNIRILDVPATGKLYVDYTGTVRDAALTADTVRDFTFHYKNAQENQISDITYLSAKSSTAATDTLRYVACDGQGEFLYAGEVVITSKAAIVVYTKSFSDVPKTTSTEWYYTAVMDLAEANVINGFDEKVNGVPVSLYKPTGEVTYGQALKLIMLATGYTTPVQTGKHWASGFLAKAQEDKLVSLSVTESYLDKKIARNDIAMIAARAMKLSDSKLTASPFADVLMSSVYAPYILSLYEAGIITGSTNKNGDTVYYGVNSITRAEMAVIVWRINNYNG